MQNGQSGAGPGIDLAQALSALLNGSGSLQTLRSLAEAHHEHSLVMRRHMLRAESELLKGLMAVVDDELKRVEAEIEESSKAPVGRQKISVE